VFSVFITKCTCVFFTDVTEYFKYLKLAVAVAVIRSRPGGMTGQQYAEQLCARYQQTQLSWKQEADRLKQQLSVVLQQKSLLGQLVNLISLTCGCGIKLIRVLVEPDYS